jgi:hypothetical protein
MAGTALAPTPETEARDQLHRIKNHWQEFWSELKDFHDNQRWGALGYTSFKKCVEAELGFTEQRAYQVLGAAAILETLRTQPWLSTEGLTERHARELLPLKDEPEAVEAVWREANKRAAGRDQPVTAAVIREVREERQQRDEGIPRTRMVQPGSPETLVYGFTGAVPLSISCACGTPFEAAVPLTEGGRGSVMCRKCGRTYSVRAEVSETVETAAVRKAALQAARRQKEAQ